MGAPFLFWSNGPMNAFCRRALLLPAALLLAVLPGPASGQT